MSKFVQLTMNGNLLTGASLGTERHICFHQGPQHMCAIPLSGTGRNPRGAWVFGNRFSNDTLDSFRASRM